MLSLLKQLLKGREGQVVPCFAEFHNLLSDGQITGITLRQGKVSARFFVISYRENSIPRKRNYRNVPLEKFSDEVIEDVARCIIENS